MSLGFEHYLNLVQESNALGRFKILSPIARGSVSMVFTCHQIGTPSQLLALKILCHEVALDDQIVTRFRNEIHASYRISHPNVVRGFEFFRTEQIQAYTMEFVDGGNFADYIRAQGTLSISESIYFLKQLTNGIKAIHAAGVIHRDIKPANILMTRSGDIKITDFNTALCKENGEYPKDFGIIGTPEYISPEVIKHGEADERSDIYAIGVIGYQMLTGRIPMTKHHNRAFGFLGLKGRPTSPKHLRLDCPDLLNKIILKSLNSNPNKRFQTADELAKTLNMIKL